MDVVAWHDIQGQSPQEIVENFPGITLADVYAALSYYHDNREEIEADFEVHRQAAEYGKTQPSLLRDAFAKHPELREKYPEVWKQFNE